MRRNDEPDAGCGARTEIVAPDKDWWRGAVIYQIYPRSFRTPTMTGSAIWRASSTACIHRRTGRRRDLDLAVLPSPMLDFGYDVSDYRDVDPMFGTLGDFDALIKVAHDHGMQVMIDLVLSTPRQTSTLVPGKPDRAATTPNPTGMSGPTQARWHAAQQLAVDLRRLGLGMGRRGAVLPAQLPHLAAGPEPPQPGGSGSPARRGALLA
jgi:hypothetical protein